MTLERRDVPELHPTAGYAHVTVADGRFAFLAGQCPVAADGSLVGEGDLAAQVAQIVANCLTALGAAGAGPEDVVRTTIYVASDHRDDLPRVWDLLRASPLAAAFSTASTLLGVTALGYTGQLVEVDVTAVLPHDGP